MLAMNNASDSFRLCFFDEIVDLVEQLEVGRTEQFSGVTTVLVIFVNQRNLSVNDVWSIYTTLGYTLSSEREN